MQVAPVGRGGDEPDGRRDWHVGLAQPRLGRGRIFENLIQNLPARESAKNLRKFACLSRPPVAPDP